MGASHSGSDSSTTYSAISDGQLTIRNTGEQQQDVANLSHDVEHANHALSPIFDKEKEQNRLREAQLIGDIGNQAMDIIRTQGAIDAANAQKDPAAIAAARDKLIAEGNTYPSTEDIAKQITNTVMQQYGTGSDYQRAAQAVTAALQGLAGGNIAQALTGAAAPYLAEQIKKMTADSPEANLMAHALLGAAVAAAKNASAAAGAIGASGELAARYIRQQLYGTDDNEALTEQQKQTISALSTLAAGLAGAIIGGDAASSLTAAQTGKNAVDNNELSLSPGWLQFGQSSTTLAEFMRLNGATPDEISDATRALAGGVGSGAPQPANGFINAWMAYVGIEALGLGVVGLIGKFSAGLAEGTVVAYRVEGTPNARLLISDDGQVLIQGDEKHYI